MVGSDFFLTFSGMSGLFLLDDAELLSKLMSPADPLIKLKEDNEESHTDPRCILNLKINQVRVKQILIKYVRIMCGVLGTEVPEHRQEPFKL